MKLKSLKLWRRVRHLTAGFSLVEVSVGMAIVGTVVTAMFSGFTTGFFTMKMSRENLRATQIMLEKVETIRLYSWDQINTADFIPQSFTNVYDPQAASGQQGTVYSGTLTISNAPIGATYADKLKLVTVTLNWKTGTLARSRTFNSYISRYGLQDYIY